MIKPDSTHRTIVNELPLVLVVDELLPNAVESCHVVKATDLVPGQGWQPGGGVAVGVVEADPARQ